MEEKEEGLAALLDQVEACHKRHKTPLKPLDHLVPGLTMSCDVLTTEDETALLQHIDACEWNTQISRRTQHYGYIYDYSARKASAKPTTPIPAWCDALIAEMQMLGLMRFTPDQMIINEYKPGQGIAAHIDKPDDFGDQIISVSLCSEVPMVFTKGDARVSVPLPRRSAVSLQKDARYTWKHSIEKQSVKERRVSLTFRKMNNKK
jgi:alkylated DNA repair dioxygenase AlkB